MPGPVARFGFGWGMLVPAVLTSVPLGLGLAVLPAALGAPVYLVSVAVCLAAGALLGTIWFGDDAAFAVQLERGGIVAVTIRGRVDLRWRDIADVRWHDDELGRFHQAEIIGRDGRRVKLTPMLRHGRDLAFVVVHGWRDGRWPDDAEAAIPDSARR